MTEDSDQINHKVNKQPLELKKERKRNDDEQLHDQEPEHQQQLQPPAGGEGGRLCAEYQNGAPTTIDLHGGYDQD